jgi:hypothetical protein
VLVLTAPREEQFERLLQQVDRSLFRRPADAGPIEEAARMPLLGRKLHLHTDWRGES